MREALELRIKATSLEADGDKLFLAVVLPASSDLIGEACLFLLSKAHRQGEVGGAFHPDHHRRGYATEAARRLLDVAFEDLDLHRVIGRIDARNDASARWLERLGMRREAHFVENEFNKGAWESEVVFAILQHEWKDARRSKARSDTAASRPESSVRPGG